MSGHDRPSPYHAFLLRCWLERSQRDDQMDVWRFSLEDPRTGSLHGFSSLDAVFAAVQATLASETAREASDQPPTHDA